MTNEQIATMTKNSPFYTEQFKLAIIESHKEIHQDAFLTMEAKAIAKKHYEKLKAIAELIAA